jgi:isopropanol dehydrogenase (NADP+)
MKAFVMKGLDRVGFSDRPAPKPRPNDAVVKTTRAFICTSDSHTVHGAIGPRENLTLGHEAVGVVHEVGTEVRLSKPGDRVVVGAITSVLANGSNGTPPAAPSGKAVGSNQHDHSRISLRAIGSRVRNHGQEA